MDKKDYYYTKTHEWACFDGDIVSVGLTEHALHQLGDIVYIEPPAIGFSAQNGKALGVIESVKAAADIYSPVDGIVVESNKDLQNDLGLFREDPYGRAWIAKIKVQNSLNKTNLLCYNEYEKFINEEEL